MKYHYFHGRFTYSVKRSGLRWGWSWASVYVLASRRLSFSC